MRLRSIAVKRIPRFHHYNSHRRSGSQTPVSCPLSATYTSWHRCIHTNTVQTFFFSVQTFLHAKILKENNPIIEHILNGDRSTTTLHLQYYNDIFGTLIVNSVPLLLLCTQVSFLAPTSDWSQLPVFTGPGNLVHFSGLLGHQKFKW